MENDDTSAGGEDLSVDQAAAAYVKATTTEEVPEDHSGVEDADESETTDDELQASDEDEGDEDEGETDDEDQAEEGEDDQPESDQGRFVADNAKVRLEDGQIISIADLKKGSLLNADYTRKTQEVAEQRRALETQSSTLKATETQLEEQREYVTSLLQSIVPPPPDPAMLQTDPMGYMSQKAQHEQWTQHLQFLQQEQQRTAQERQAKSSETEQETLNREWQALLAKAPELAEDKKRDRFVNDLKEHAQAYGIKPEELKAVAMDHRQALVLRDAIAWRKLQASKTQVAKKVEGRPPVQKGGKRLNPQARRVRQAEEAITRLKSSGSVEDAARAYLARKG